MKAEKSGDLDKARKKYAEAYGRNSAHVGAELARLRLLARSPAAHAAVDEDLKALAKKKGTQPDVALFAAWWALLKGDLKSAKAQLDGVSVPAKHAHAALLRADKKRLGAALATAVERERRKRDGTSKSTLEQQRVAARLLRQGKAKAAADILGGLIAFGRDVHWSSHFNMGVAKVMLGELKGAREAFSTAAGMCPSCAPAARNAALLKGP